MDIVCISDTHDQHQVLDIPRCDLLVHAGDMTSGKDSQVLDFLDWFAQQPAQYKVFTHGNHDWRAFEKHRREYADMARARGCWYVDGWTLVLPKLDGIRIHGSALDRVRADKGYVLDHCDILVTHEPPYGILDKIENPRIGEDANGHIGSHRLLRQVEKYQPKLHIMGHIHEGYGIYQSSPSHTKFINAALCNEHDCTLDKQPIRISL